jgi:hypothetical protein
MSTSEPPCLLEALRLAELGWLVFPCWGLRNRHGVDGNLLCACGNDSCKNQGKHPIGSLVPHGLLDATRDQKLLRKWWTAFPDATLAVATGESGLIVIDIDPRHGGDVTWDRILKTAGESVAGDMSGVPESETGGGGSHYIFLSPEGQRIMSRNGALGAGADVKATGGYIIAPPSRHASGNYYRWKRPPTGDQLPPPPFPWLLPLLLRRQSEQSYSAGGAADDSHHAGDDGQDPFDILAALDGVNEGKRQDILFRAACSFRGTGTAKKVALRACLEAAGRCKPPFSSIEVLKIIERVWRKYPAGCRKGEGPVADHPYLLQNGCLAYRCGIKKDKQGNVTTTTQRIANFSGEIVAEFQRDDGIEVAREFKLLLIRDEERREFVLPAGQFNPHEIQKWLPERAGSRFALDVFKYVDSHFIAAVKNLSSPSLSYMFSYTGWLKIDGVWRYLHLGQDHVALDLSPRLAHFKLPDAPSGEELKAALMTSPLLDRGNLAPDEITFRLFCAPFFATLGLKQDFTLMLVGRTGIFKTELATLAQQHYGAGFGATALPTYFHDTAFYIERVAFSAKDCAIVVDDFRPGTTNHDRAVAFAKLDYIVRGSSSGAGRERLTREIGFRPDRHPRCIPIVTAEEGAGNESTLGRLFGIRMKKGDVTTEALTRAQAAAAGGAYARTMSAYIKWLGLCFEMRQAHAQLAQKKHRERIYAAVNQEMHARLPGIVADLFVGLEVFAEFAHDAGVLSDSQQCELLDRGWAGLVGAAGIQTKDQQEEDPVKVFLTALRAGLLGGVTHLEHQKTGEEPIFDGHNLASQLGWREEIYGSRPSWKPNGLCAGWVNVTPEDQVHIYLNFKLAYQAATKVAGRPIPVEERILKQRLLEANLLVQVAPKSSGRPCSVQRVVKRVSYDVVFLRTEALFPPPLDRNGKPVGEHGLLFKTGHNEDLDDCQTGAEWSEV